MGSRGRDVENFTFMSNKEQEGEASLTFERPLREIQFLPMIPKHLVTGVYIMVFLKRFARCTGKHLRWSLPSVKLLILPARCFSLSNVYRKLNVAASKLYLLTLYVLTL